MVSELAGKQARKEPGRREAKEYDQDAYFGRVRKSLTQNSSKRAKGGKLRRKMMLNLSKDL